MLYFFGEIEPKGSCDRGGERIIPLRAINRLTECDRLMAGQTADGLSGFIGRLNVVFVLILLCGALAVVSGWFHAHSGRTNRAIAFGILIVFAIALFVAYTALKAVNAA